MITSEQAYAAGPDGVVDTSEGSPFRQYMAQQDIYKANVGPGSAIANSLSGGQNYLANNVDVFTNAQERAQSEGLSGNAYANRLDEIAREHYDLYGRAEGRAGFGNPPPPLMDGAPSTFSGGNTYGGPGGYGFPTNPNDIPSFGAGDRSRTNTPGANINPGNGQSQQSTFDNSGYQTALNNFGGLLNNYGDFFGGLLSGAQNAQTNMQPQGQNFTGFYGPQQAATGFGGGFNNFGNFGGALSGGFSNASTWGGGGNASSGGNTGHRQLWTT